MSGNVGESLSAVDLTDDTYTVEQSLIRNKYKATDANDEVVLRGKQKMFKMKEEFPFTDGDGNEVFSVKAGGVLDVAGNYTMIDAVTDEPVVILDNDFSIFQDTWRVRDPDTEELLAQIDSRGAVVTLARHYVPFGALIPHKYEITDSDGEHVGNISGQLSVRDTYEITIDDPRGLPKEAIVAAAMVIDAIQGN